MRALTRGDSWKTLPPGVVSVHGDALDAATYRDKIAPADTFVHLVGTPHPGPGKAHQFRNVDLASIEAAVAAATHAGVSHFVYLSVAQPAPIMRAYIEVRQRGETLVRASAMRATMVRPWYVLGPGRSWPLLLGPVYGIMERLRPTREFARRLGLVTITEMTRTLVKAVEDPPEKLRIFDVPDIRSEGAA